jgi:hypothetical protein
LDTDREAELAETTERNLSWKLPMRLPSMCASSTAGAAWSGEVMRAQQGARAMVHADHDTTGPWHDIVHTGRIRAELGFRPRH